MKISRPNDLLTHMALWQTLQRKQSHRVYVWVNCQPYKRLDWWEPWKDNQIPETRFVEFFRLSLADFNWLSDMLRDELQQDLLGRGKPLTVEAQVAVGLYRLGHGATYVTIGHVFTGLCRVISGCHPSLPAAWHAKSAHTWQRPSGRCNKAISRFYNLKSTRGVDLSWFWDQFITKSCYFSTQT
jgi:hypothetical protein